MIAVTDSFAKTHYSVKKYEIVASQSAGEGGEGSACPSIQPPYRYQNNVSSYGLWKAEKLALSDGMTHDSCCSTAT